MKVYLERNRSTTKASTMKGSGCSDSKEHKCHVEVVHERDRNTLQEIIIEHINPQTNARILSDGWSAYAKLEELGYKQEVVIHEREFKNTEGYHTEG